MSRINELYVLVWHSPDGDFIYGYTTSKQLLDVIATFNGKDYIHYEAYKVVGLQKLLFEH